MDNDSNDKNNDPVFTIPTQSEWQYVKSKGYQGGFVIEWEYVLVRQRIIRILCQHCTDIFYDDGKNTSRKLSDHRKKCLNKGNVSNNYKFTTTNNASNSDDKYIPSKRSLSRKSNIDNNDTSNFLTKNNNKKKRAKNNKDFTSNDVEAINNEDQQRSSTNNIVFNDYCNTSSDITSAASIERLENEVIEKYPKSLDALCFVATAMSYGLTVAFPHEGPEK